MWRVVIEKSILNNVYKHTTQKKIVNHVAKYKEIAYKSSRKYKKGWREH